MVAFSDHLLSSTIWPTLLQVLGRQNISRRCTKCLLT